MSKLDQFLKEYADNAGIILNELGPGLAAPPPGVDPAADAGGIGPMPPMGPPPAVPSTVPGKTDAKAKAEEFISADEIVEFTQNIKDALGIDPSTLSAAEKGDAFSDDITPENAEIKLAEIRNIISTHADITNVGTD
jgi:hypothetical protein